MLGALPGAVLIACADGTTSVEPGLERPFGVEQARLGASLLGDAASRSATALADPDVVVSLRAQLGVAAHRMAAGDEAGALNAVLVARAMLDRYDARAESADAADRAVIALALDGAERLLRETPASQ